MPYKSMSEVNLALKGIKPPITLSQANEIAAIADGVGTDVESPWGIAISAFKKAYRVENERWVKNEGSQMGELSLASVMPSYLGGERTIINEAGNADSGHRGHRGIPGYRGGSLPAANTPLGWGLPSDEALAKNPEWLGGIIKALMTDAQGKGAFDAPADDLNAALLRLVDNPEVCKEAILGTIDYVNYNIKKSELMRAKAWADYKDLERTAPAHVRNFPAFMEGLVKSVIAPKIREIESQYRPMTPEEQATYENRRLTQLQPIRVEQRPATVEGLKAAIADYESLIIANGGKTTIDSPNKFGGIVHSDFRGDLDSLKGALTGIQSVSSNDPDAAKWTAMFLRNAASSMEAEKIQAVANSIVSAANDSSRVLVEHLDRVAAQAQFSFDVQQGKMTKPTLETYRGAKHVGDDLAPAGTFSAWDKADTRAESRKAGGNATLREIQHYQGFDGAPKVVPSHIFDEMATKGSMYVVYRGLHSQERTYSVRFGEHYPGLGIYGDGTYTSPTRSYTDSYTKDTGQMRMALAPGSKVVRFGDLSARYQAEKAKPGANKHPELDDEGSYAAWLGYDAIDCRGTTPDTHLLVLNRTALLVDVRDYKAMGE